MCGTKIVMLQDPICTNWREALFDLEVRYVIPYVEQLVLSSIPVSGWIIDPYVHSLLDGPGEDIWLPTQSGESA